MNIRFLGAHNVDSLHSRNPCLLIDGVIALDAGALTHSLTLPEQRSIKAIILTHQHFDHVRDIPGIALIFYHSKATLNIYAPKTVCDALTSHFFDGVLYPKFLERPPENPAVKLHLVEPGKNFYVEGYDILPVPVYHAAPTVGYQVTSPQGGSFFYTGDTGTGLEVTWKNISPKLLIIETTLCNRNEALVKEPKHLTPGLLKQELISFGKVRGYLPRVITFHMDPDDEAEIRSEVAIVSRELGCSITLATEGMETNL